MRIHTFVIWTCYNWMRKRQVQRSITRYTAASREPCFVYVIKGSG